MYVSYTLHRITQLLLSDTGPATLGREKVRFGNSPCTFRWKKVAVVLSHARRNY